MMKCRDVGRKRVDVGRGQLAAHKHLARQTVLRKLAHLHGVFDDGSGAAEDGGLPAAGDRDDVEIELGRKTTIEAQLFVTIEASRCQGTEIQKTEFYRLFDLVGELPGQKDIGNVRFDQDNTLSPDT
ncbi:MAG: hypothetical protein ABW318_22200 [Vicinamibacterales bacterium]